ncbi:peptide ABC transporter substrate-binding protein [Carnobacterium viridans]|uniref:Oligopeptide transport system substrate-binding protein n=1 Tax=Carnobacterium viridans TaxID=174587 RepID=A0A1H1A6Q1_9LACT|nr:peptide ABC transporter substrate-binding protein [Carnobacterium viridans]UDE94276.1 peptide ABC transporter substrate-binding protein [Carnobacterium viridans]SDQ35385.1 oligopeptide transport system substrate-binding protein [Carnobacterium viridans]
MNNQIKGLGILSLAVLLSACGSTETNGSSTESNSADGEKNLADTQELRLTAASEIPSMDTALATDLTSFTVMNNVFEGLYVLGPDAEPVLGVAAEEPTISEDGKTYTFKLREDAFWSNGEPVTADDFVYAWQKVAAPETASGYAYMFDGLIQNATEIINDEMDPTELGIKALSDTELEITLMQPTSYFDQLLTLPFFFPQNRAFAQEQGDEYGSTNETLVYNGPFVLEGWNQASSVGWTFEKNEDYWDADSVVLDTVTVDVIKEVTTELNLFENGETDIAFLSGNFVSQYSEDPNFHSSLNATTFYIEMNHLNNEETTELSNANIRLAIASAIDKDGYVDNVLQDGSASIDGFVPAGLASNPTTKSDFREDAGNLLPYDLEKATEAWNAGLSELGTESIELELITSDTEDSKRLAEYLQDQLQKNLPGLTVTLRSMPFSMKLETVREGNYDMAVNSWIADFADPINYVERFDTDINRMNYSNPDVDALVDIAKAIFDDDEARWETLVEIEKVSLGEDAALAPLYQSADSYLLNPKVKDYYKRVFGPDSYKWTWIEAE